MSIELNLYQAKALVEMLEASDDPAEDPSSSRKATAIADLASTPTGASAPKRGPSSYVYQAMLSAAPAAAQDERNQCDGCLSGVPVDQNGNHRMGRRSGYADLMACQKDRYLPQGGEK